MKNFAITVAKIIVAGLALYYVLSVTDVSRIWEYIKKANPIFLLLAFALLNISTLLNGMRLKVYINHHGCKVGAKKAVKLFYIGTAFNLVLPGGIGGDGYLAVKFKAAYKIRLLNAMKILISARANGLLFLNIALFSLLYFSDFTHLFPHQDAVVTGLFILQFPVYFGFIKYFLKENLKSFLNASFYSFLSQIAILTMVLCILFAMKVTNNHMDYLVLYTASAVASVIPVTPGGMGIREIIYFQGATLAGLNPEVAVACSLIYFSIYFLTGMVGLIFYFSRTK